MIIEGVLYLPSKTAWESEVLEHQSPMVEKESVRLCQFQGEAGRDL